MFRKGGRFSRIYRSRDEYKYYNVGAHRVKMLRNRPLKVIDLYFVLSQTTWKYIYFRPSSGLLPASGMWVFVRPHCAHSPMGYV